MFAHSCLLLAAAAGLAHSALASSSPHVDGTLEIMVAGGRALTRANTVPTQDMLFSGTDNADTEYGIKDRQTEFGLKPFPREDPSEAELHDWLTSTDDKLKSAGLERYARPGIITASGMYTERAEITMPPEGTGPGELPADSPIRQQLFFKNLDIKSSNQLARTRWTGRGEGHYLRL